MNINKNILLSKTDITISKYVCLSLKGNLQALHKKKKLKLKTKTPASHSLSFSFN